MKRWVYATSGFALLAFWLSSQMAAFSPYPWATYYATKRTGNIKIDGEGTHETATSLVRQERPVLAQLPVFRYPHSLEFLTEGGAEPQPGT